MGALLDTLRKPFLVIAIVLLGLAVLIEIGETSLLGNWPSRVAAMLRAESSPAQDIAQSLEDRLPPSEVKEALKNLDSEQREQLQQLAMIRESRPPGIAIPYMALVDGIALFTVVLIGLSLVIPARIQGRVQGVLTLIFSILIIIAAIGMILAAIALLITMVAMLLAIPFGTIVYLILFGSFDTSSALAILSLLMFLKFGFVVCLLLAQQRFVTNVGLVLIVVTALAATIAVGFLHSLVPGFLVSITDAIGGIVVGVCAAIWAIVLLVGSIGSVIKAARLKV